MEIKTLLRANLKSHKGTAAGSFFLLLLVGISLCATLTVWHNAGNYVRGEMERLGYGDLTAWVSGLEDVSVLAEEIAALEEVDSVGTQSLLFSEYEVGEQESDSEGQLITYNPEQYPYKFFNEAFTGYIPAPAEIAPGTLYAPASLRSMFGVEAGSSITFPIARSGGDVAFTVAGFYEDPVMGSSMIGMKGFLICEADHEAIAAMIGQAGVDALAREGFMLHITQKGNLPAAPFNALLNQETSLSQHTEFTHSFSAMAGFMLTLQNVFTGLLLAFVVIFLLAALAVLSHSISSAIQQDYRDMGILKALGITTSALRAVQALQVLLAAGGGIACGALLAVPAASFLCGMTVTTTGVLVPASLPIGLCLPLLLLLLATVCGFSWLRAGKLKAVSPLVAIRSGMEKGEWKKSPLPLRKRGLAFWMAARQVLVGKGRYAGTCLVAALLVFFAGLMGRVDSWLGPNGEGLMDAFNPADLHIAAQPMGETSLSAVEEVIESCTPIIDRYDLAMPTVSVNGVDMTANVITEPERFHILSGRTCQAADEVVLTEFAAADLGVAVGDTVTLAGTLGSGEYTVSGIYQCANDMGQNIGLSREGYVSLGEDTPQMWCTHYFLEDPSLQPQVMEALSAAFGGDVYLHENSWPGLSGILSAMGLLMAFLYTMVAVFVLVATLLTVEKLLRSERRDLAIYRALGFSARRLQVSFALRFCLVGLAGSLLGTALSAVLTDPLVALLLRAEGISNFSSQPGWIVVALPGAVVTGLFSLFALLAAGKLKRIPLSTIASQ